VAAIIPFYLALGTGKAAIIVPLTALYPVVTLMLSLLILQEKVTLLQAVGIILALVAIILMSS
jgi:transporter family protein